jgi:hypothetical protein
MAGDDRISVEHESTILVLSHSEWKILFSYWLLEGAYPFAFNSLFPETTMNKPLNLLALCLSIIALALTASQCNRPKPLPSIAENKSNFQKTVYTQPKTGETIRLISESQCEIDNNKGTILLAEYSREGNRLRVVTKVDGTDAVHYFDIIAEGLRVPNRSGPVYLSPEALDKFAKVERQADADHAARKVAPTGRVRKPEIITAGDVQAQGRNLRDGEGDTAQLTATIADVVQADGGKTVYIEFGSGRGKNDLCAKHEENPARYNSWKLLKGKRVLIPGTVIIEESSGRVTIEIEPGDDIKLAD